MTLILFISCIWKTQISAVTLEDDAALQALNVKKCSITLSFLFPTDTVSNVYILTFHSLPISKRGWWLLKFLTILPALQLPPGSWDRCCSLLPLNRLKFARAGFQLIWLVLEPAAMDMWGPLSSSFPTFFLSLFLFKKIKTIRKLKEQYNKGPHSLQKGWIHHICFSLMQMYTCTCASHESLV